MNNQLNAFTILEVLISLILTGIIIALTYSLFLLIGKQLALFEKENSEILEYNIFNTTIKHDIEDSVDFKILDDKLHLIDYKESTIIYYVANQKILRTSQITIDTFDVHVNSFTYESSNESSKNVFKVDLQLLNENVNANYYLQKDFSRKINNTYFHED